MAEHSGDPGPSEDLPLTLCLREHVALGLLRVCTKSQLSAGLGSAKALLPHPFPDSPAFCLLKTVYRPSLAPGQGTWKGTTQVALEDQTGGEELGRAGGLCWGQRAEEAPDPAGRSGRRP